MARVLIKELNSIRRQNNTEAIRALNIGCGVGIGRNPALLDAVNLEIDEHWAVEPDTTIEAAPFFANFQHNTMEDAVLPEAYFDIAYSSMVVEHVQDPKRFLAAVSRCLRPGGIHFFMTVNGSHYFAHLARLANRLGIEYLALRLVRGEQNTAGYHYEVAYRMNTVKSIRKLAVQCGFAEVDFAFVEGDGPKPYFPGPLRPIYWVMAAKRKLIRNPAVLLTMLCRMTRG